MAIFFNLTRYNFHVPMYGQVVRLPVTYPGWQSPLLAPLPSLYGQAVRLPVTYPGFRVIFLRYAERTHATRPYRRLPRRNEMITFPLHTGNPQPLTTASSPDDRIAIYASCRIVRLPL
mgnify:CR=1 FL=1